jgi:MoaA/NifB/PqqE/SkfB family radical SAM enzyme
MLATARVVKHETIHADDRTGYQYNVKALRGSGKKWFQLRVSYHLLVLALKTYRSLSVSLYVLRRLEMFKKSIIGSGETKIIRANGKYYHYLYAPGYPSKIFDDYIVGEFNRISPVKRKTNLLNFLFFAITSKCPLQCEHCFEWDNLNKKESLALHHLKAVVNKFQNDGLTQFHLSGGEPLTRVKDLAQLISGARKVSEFYVLTSGFNFTAANAGLLKKAGLTGVVISLDHYDKEKHNAFRGLKDSYSQAVNAVHYAQKHHLVVALTICITREFISWKNLLLYVEMAKKLKVVFVQLLEPKAVGHYKGKDVYLTQSEMDMLERFCEMLNFGAGYEDYPILVYHGSYQKRVGCMSGGNRGLYIDSEGYVNACPFCHTKNFNIKEVLETQAGFPALVKSAHCPA